MEMEGTYEVISGGQAVGSVTVSRQGLYYHFSCRCRISGEIMFRLIMEIEGISRDLGILVPIDGQFGLNTWVSMKSQGKEKPSFLLRPKREALDGILVRICPEEPFSYLTKLESAYLVRKNGEMMVGFREEK
jgi:hypothetical protein